MNKESITIFLLMSLAGLGLCILLIRAHQQIKLLRDALDRQLEINEELVDTNAELMAAKESE